ncbi:hypothetical protein BC832DRAFT_19386 [Gaertneriomyces semiglobifer]|nr:hypothetical protein BC832DRAFT_19386 [Gaertneriomyces semiglobifer]
MLEEARSIAASLDTTSTSPLNQAAKGNQQNNMHQNPHNNSYNSWERSNYNRSGHDRVPPNIPSSVANHTDPSRILGVPQVDPKSSSPQYNSRGSDGAFEGRASLPPQQHSSANTGSGPPHKQFSTPSPQNMMNGSHQQNYRPNSNLRPNENKGQAQSNAPMNSTYMQGHGNAMQERSNYNNQMLSGKQGGSFNDASRSAAAVPQALAPTTKQSPQGIKRPLEQQRSDYLGAGKQHGLAEGSPHLSAMRAPSIDANDKGQNNAQNYQYTNPIVKRPRGDIPGFN